MGQYFAVDGDIGFFHGVNKGAVGQAFHAHGGVNALNPEAFELTLFVAPITILVLQAFFDLFNRHCKAAFGTAAVAFGQFKDFFVAAAVASPIRCTGHIRLLPLLGHSGGFGRTAGLVS